VASTTATMLGTLEESLRMVLLRHPPEVTWFFPRKPLVRALGSVWRDDNVFFGFRRGDSALPGALARVRGSAGDGT